jgi:hypothetical protein
MIDKAFCFNEGIILKNISEEVNSEKEWKEKSENLISYAAQKKQKLN